MLWLSACTGAYTGPDPSGEGAAVYGRVLDLFGGGVADAQICEEACVRSGDDGSFLLEPLPTEADVVVSMEKDGLLPTAFLHHTAVDEEWEKTLMPMSLVESMGERVDTTLDPALGHTLFILWSGPDYEAFSRVEGVSFTIDADAVRFYQADGGMPDPALDSTSASGAGGVFNLAPGDYSLTFSGATCAPWFSWDFEAGGAVPVTVRAGFASYMDLVCT